MLTKRYPWLALAGAAAVLAVTPAGVASAGGVTQISGETGDVACDNPPIASPDYVLPLVGDLNGCVYGYITSAREHPSGTYQEVADEIFVGSWGDLQGTWEMTENFTAKYGADTVSGAFFGRCKHPIVTGSGTGDFEGISGRLDFKDDVDAGSAAYRGHLRLG
jgi:hypothetical protein